MTTNITQRNDYDHAGRVLKSYHQINSNAEVTVAKYEYNSLGQLVDKKLHDQGSGNFLQSIDYRYNIQGMPRSINNARLDSDNNVTNDETNDFFGMEMIYSEAESLGNTPRHNGNLSAIKWKGPGPAGNDNQRSYKYFYDKSDNKDSSDED